MSETMTTYRHDSDSLNNGTDFPQMPNLEKHIVKASSHPPKKPTIEQFNNNYPQLDPSLLALVVQPDSLRSTHLDGNLMLENLHEKACDWALEPQYVGLTDEQIEDALVRRVQIEFNIALDSRAIEAAKGIARDAVRVTLHGSIEVPEPPQQVETIGAPLRDDVSSVVAFVGPKPDRRIRHKLLTPEERKKYGIDRITIKEKKLSKKVLAEIFKSDETGQGE